MIKLFFILLFAAFCMVGAVAQSMCDNYMK